MGWIAGLEVAVLGFEPRIIQPSARSIHRLWCSCPSVNYVCSRSGGSRAGRVDMYCAQLCCGGGLTQDGVWVFNVTFHLCAPFWSCNTLRLICFFFQMSEFCLMDICQASLGEQATRRNIEGNITSIIYLMFLSGFIAVLPR